MVSGSFSQRNYWTLNLQSRFYQISSPFLNPPPSPFHRQAFAHDFLFSIDAFFLSSPSPSLSHSTTKIEFLVLWCGDQEWMAEKKEERMRKKEKFYVIRISLICVILRRSSSSSCIPSYCSQCICLFHFSILWLFSLSVPFYISSRDFLLLDGARSFSAIIDNPFSLMYNIGIQHQNAMYTECPPATDGMERFACPTPDRQGRYRCIDDHVLCDGKNFS